MGTFSAHVVAGSFLLTFAGWWAVSSWHRFFQGRRRWTTVSSADHGRFHKNNRASSTLFCCPGFPSEGVFKVVACISGVSVEIYQAYQYSTVGNVVTLQHISMYSFFGLSGAVDILTNSGLPLPWGIDYAALLLAFLMEGLLFYFHIQGRTPLNYHVHFILVLITAATVLLILLEMIFPRQYLCRLLRSLTCMLQATWLYQIAFILFNPLPGAVPWNEFDREQMMMVIILLCAHLASAVVFLVLTGLFVYWWTCRFTPQEDLPFQSLPTDDMHENTKKFIKKIGMTESSNGHAVVNG